MALNFLGLGFSLGAEDKGLAHAIKSTTSGLADIAKSVVGIGLASTKMVLKPPDFRPAIGLVNTLANDVKTTTTSLEAYGVAASKTTSAGLAGLNLTEKQFKKAQGRIASLAFGMNVPVDSVTKSFSALTQAGVDVNDMARVGFKSFDEFQKVMEVTGADSTKVAGALGKMSTQMGMSKVEIKATLTSVAAIGKKFNIGREAIAGMSDTVEILNANANLLPQNWSPAKMSKFLKGTTVVAGALTSVGVTADDAMAASKALTAKLLEGSTGMAKLYSGLETDIPAVMGVVTEHLGSFDDAFKMLSESPDQFMLQMSKMVSEVDKMDLDPNAMNRFRLQMEKQFGPEVMAAFTKKGFGKIGPAIQEANKPIKDQENALTDLSKKYQSGRTHAELFAIAQARVQTQLKQVHGVMSDTKYLQEYTRQSQDFVKTASKLAEKGGLLGKLTSGFIDVKNRGLGGAIAAHGQWGFALSEGLKLMAPTLQYLPALAIAFKALMSPIALVAGAIAGLVFVFRDLGKGDESVVRPFMKKMVAAAPAFLGKVKEIFLSAVSAIYEVMKSINWSAVGRAVIDGFTWAFNGIFKVIEMIDWGRVGDFLGEALRKTVELAFALAFKAIDLIGRFIDWFTGLDWEKIGNYLGQVITGLFAVAVDAIWTVIKRIPDMFVAVVKLVLGVLDGIEAAIREKFPIIGAFIGPFIAMLKVVLIPVLVGVGIHFVALGVKAVYAAMTTAAAWIKASIQTAAATGTMVTGLIILGVESMILGLKMAKAWIIGLGPIAWIVAAVIGLGVVIYKFGDKILSFLSGIWDGIKSAAKTAWDFIKGIILSPIEAIKAAWGAIKGFFSGLWDGIKGVASKVWDGIKSVITSPISAVKSAWNSVSGFFGGLWDGIKSVAKSAMDAVTGSSSSSIDSVKKDLGSPSINQIVKNQIDTINKKMGEIKQEAAKTASQSIALVGDTAKGIKDVTVEAVSKSSDETIRANRNTAAAVDAYVNKTEMHLNKAGKLIFPKLTGDENVDLFQKFATAQQKLNTAQEQFNIISGIGFKENMKKEEVLAMIEQRKKLLAGKDFGEERIRLAKLAESLREEATDLSKQVGVAFGANAKFLWERSGMKEISDSFTKLDVKASEMEITSRKAMEDRIAQRKTYYLGEELRLRAVREKAIAAGDDITKLDAQMKDLSLARSAEMMNLSQEIDLLNGKQIGAIKDLGTSLETFVRAERSVVKAASDEFIKKFGPSGDAVTAVMDGQKKIDASYDVSLTKIKNNAQEAAARARELYKNQPVQLKEALQKIGKDLEDSMTKAANEHDQLIKSFRTTAIANIAGLKDNSAGAIKVIGEAAELAQKKIDETSKAGANKVAKHATDTKKIVSEELKLGANEAAESIARISVINPNDFRKGVRIIREEAIGMLQAMDTQGVKLLKDINVNIKKFFDDSKRGWNDQEALIKTFSEKATAHIATYWTKAIDEATKATGAFTMFVKNIETSLRTMTRSVNIMDLLASPSQISMWAASVVAALATAFRTGGAVDALILTSYQKALAAAAELSKAAPSTPDTTGATSPATPGGMTEVAMIKAIDNPKWATEKESLIPAALALMNENLVKALQAMGQVAETRTTPKGGRPLGGPGR